MRHFIALLSAGSFVALGASGAAQADIGDQLFKLLAEDGAGSDDFGDAVAISGRLAIVGARGDTDFGECSGSAYIFDTTTGQQLFKLLADDGAEHDHFGGSVAIGGPAGNEIAVIGAALDDDNGDASGSVYLFDATTSQQLFKLLADDGAAEDQFGGCVAISGTTTIVTAYTDDNANGENAGAVYLFNTTTGQQLAKLLPEDGAADDLFGNRVAISGGIAIVAAIGDDDNGEDSGSAYLFDVTDPSNPVQIAKLLLDDADGEDDGFGSSVAISGTTAIVGDPLSGTFGRGRSERRRRCSPLHNTSALTPLVRIARRTWVSTPKTRLLAHQGDSMPLYGHGPQLPRSSDMQEGKSLNGCSTPACRHTSSTLMVLSRETFRYVRSLLALQSTRSSTLRFCG